MITVKGLLSRIMEKVVDYKSVTRLCPATTIVTDTQVTVTLSESVANFAFIRVGVYEEYNGSTSFLVPSFATQSKVSGTYVTQKYVCEVADEYIYLNVLPTSATQIKVKLDSASSFPTTLHLYFHGVGRVK